MSASFPAAPLLKKRPPKIGLISAPVWLTRHLLVAAIGGFLMTPLHFRFLAVDKRDSMLLKRKEFCWLGPQSLSLQPQTCSLLSRRVLNHLLKTEPADLPADSLGTNPQYSQALSDLPAVQAASQGCLISRLSQLNDRAYPGWDA